MRHTKFDVPWPFLLENVVHFLTPLSQFFAKIIIRMTKVEQFSKCSFGEIGSQELTTSSYTWK